MTRSVSGKDKIVLDLTDISTEICTRIVRQNTMFVIERWKNVSTSRIDRFPISSENVNKLVKMDREKAWKAIEKLLGVSPI